MPLKRTDADRNDTQVSLIFIISFIRLFIFHYRHFIPAALTRTIAPKFRPSPLEPLAAALAASA
jgi:hypothetical protein